jgi:hypothetical protein
MHKASTLALKATAKSGRDAAALDAGAKAAMSFSSSTSDQAGALMRSIRNGVEKVDRSAAAALGRSVATQSEVVLSFGRATAHVSGASAASTVSTLDLLANEQSGVTAALVDQLGVNSHSRRVHGALERAISRSTRTEAALNAQIAELARQA